MYLSGYLKTVLSLLVLVQPPDQRRVVICLKHSIDLLTKELFQEPFLDLMEMILSIL